MVSQIALNGNGNGNFFTRPNQATAALGSLSVTVGSSFHHAYEVGSAYVGRTARSISMPRVVTHVTQQAAWFIDSFREGQRLAREEQALKVLKTKEHQNLVRQEQALSSLTDTDLFRFMRTDLEEVIRHPQIFAPALERLFQVDVSTANVALFRTISIYVHRPKKFAQDRHDALASLVAFINLRPDIKWQPHVLGKLMEANDNQDLRRAIARNPHLKDATGIRLLPPPTERAISSETPDTLVA